MELSVVGRKKIDRSVNIFKLVIGELSSDLRTRLLQFKPLHCI